MSFLLENSKVLIIIELYELRTLYWAAKLTLYIMLKLFSGLPDIILRYA